MSIGWSWQNWNFLLLLLFKRTRFFLINFWLTFNQVLKIFASKTDYFDHARESCHAVTSFVCLPSIIVHHLIFSNSDWFKLLTWRDNGRPRMLMFLKLVYLPSKLRFSANICFKNIKFPRGNYQPIVPRQKHSIVEIDDRHRPITARAVSQLLY